MLYQYPANLNQYRFVKDVLSFVGAKEKAEAHRKTGNPRGRTLKKKH